MTTEDLNLIKEILPRLNAGRADAYEDWLAVGMALHHAGAPCELWENWSRQSAKFKDGVCAQKWKSFSTTGTTLGIGSLVEWARTDGFDPYAGQAFEWDDIAPISGVDAPKISAFFNNSDLVRYLQAVFKPDEIVNYVVSSYERDGKYLPASKGDARVVSELIAALRKYEKDITFAIGDYDKAAGAWIRFNPVKPETDGSKNADIADYRHALIESDEMDIDAQLATIKRLRLPCAAIVNSGGKSVHAIVKIDAGDDLKLYKDRVAFLFSVLEKEGFVVDKACKNPSRLSRMPGVQRGERRQFLIATNEGCASWAEWEAEVKANDFEYEEITPAQMFDAPDNDKSDSLLGDRFLCREGSWLIVAQSGIGKSVIAMQAAISFSIGRPLFGLKPKSPLRCLLIQAENNRLDLVEPFKSICGMFELTADEKRLLKENLTVVSNDINSGESFTRFLNHIAKKHRPDLVFLDPLLSFFGDDISKQAPCSRFLRNLLNPVLHKWKFGLIVMHHTGKPRGKDEEQSGNALSYAGTGSSELTNWARATSTIIESAEDENVYEFAYNKRKGRCGCNEKIYLKHAENGAIFWVEAEKPAEPVKVKKCRTKYDGQGWEELAPMTYPELVEQIKNICSAAFGEEISDKKADNIRRALLTNGKIVLDKNTKKYQGVWVWER